MRKAGFALALCMAVTLIGGCENTVISKNDGKSTEVNQQSNDKKSDEGNAEDKDADSDEVSKKKKSGKNVDYMGELDTSKKKYEINAPQFAGASIQSGTQRTFIDKDGKEKGTYIACMEIDDNSYKVAKDSTEDINVWGLVDRDGNELIPCECASIEPINERFYNVIYTTGETKNEDEAYVYSYTGYFSLKPKDDDTLYKGYSKIYDIEEKQFVGDLKLTYAGCDVEAKGGLILYSDENESYVVDAAGKVLVQNKSRYSLEIGENVIINHDDSGYVLYDVTGAKQYSGKDNMSVIEGDNSYVLRYFSDNGNVETEIINLKGERVCETLYNTVYRIEDDIIYAKNKENKTGLATLDGKEIATFVEGATFTYGDGVWYGRDDEDSTYAVYGKDGLIADKLESVDVGNLIFKMNEQANPTADCCEVLVLEKDAGYAVFANETPKVLTKGVVAAKDKEADAYAVYDVRADKTYLDSEYEEVEYACGRVFAKKDGIWEIYELKK
jgi:hypothetical protein